MEKQLVEEGQDQQILPVNTTRQRQAAALFAIFVLGLTPILTVYAVSRSWRFQAQPANFSNDFCKQNSLCQGLSDAVVVYVNGKYNDKVQANALLGYAQTINRIKDVGPNDAYARLLIDVQVIRRRFGPKFMADLDYFQSLLFKTGWDLQQYINVMLGYEGDFIELQQYLVDSYMSSLTQWSSVRLGKVRCTLKLRSLFLAMEVGLTPDGLVHNLLTIKETLTQRGFDYDKFSILRPAGLRQHIKQVEQKTAETLNVSRNLFNLAVLCALKMRVPDWLADYQQNGVSLRELLISVYRELSLTSQRLYSSQRIAVHITNQVWRGRPTMILGHSIAAAIANATFSKLNSEDAKSVGLTFISPIANRLININYMTQSNDSFIREVTGSMPSMNANLDSRAWQGLLNHDPAGYVLNYPEDFADMIQKAEDELQQPELNHGDGDLVISLSWNVQSQVSLQIVEPDGTVLDSDNIYGKMGYLEVDYPQQLLIIYFTYCSRLSPGIFNINVVYKQLGKPVEATLKIQAAGISKIVTKTLDATSQGKSKFVSFGTITAILNERMEQLAYQILE